MNSAAAHLFQEDLYQLPQSVVVILARPWQKISDEEKALLAKILGAVRVNIESVNIISQESVSIEALSVLNPGKVLVFGSSLQESIKPYENVLINGIAVLRADDFPALDDARKKTLWLALKQMFGV